MRLIVPEISGDLITEQFISYPVIKIPADLSNRGSLLTLVRVRRRLTGCEAENNTVSYICFPITFISSVFMDELLHLCPTPDSQGGH